MRKAKDKPESHLAKNLAVIGIVYSFIMVGLCYCEGGCTPSTPPKSQADIKQELVAGPKPVNNAWDASVIEVKLFLRENLNDPDSVQYLEWSPVFAYDEYWSVRCKYRAKNSFGALILAEKLFYIQNGKVVHFEDYEK